MKITSSQRKPITRNDLRPVMKAVALDSSMRKFIASLNSRSILRNITKLAFVKPTTRIMKSKQFQLESK
jgi:hypothetical protein